MLPDKPIMLRWRQSDKSPTDLNTSLISSVKSGMSSFTVSLPKNTESSKKESPTLGGAKFVNFTAASSHQKKILQRSKEKRKINSSPKGRPKITGKAQDKEVQRRVVRTPHDVLEPLKDQGLVARYPSPLDRYFFKATSFPFTSLDSLNTGHYTNYCKPSTQGSLLESIVDIGRSTWHCQYDVSAHRKSIFQSYKG